MIRYEDLAEKVRKNHPEAALEMIQRGYVVSAKYHKGQVRMSGEAYLTHPLEVANILAELKLDVVTITAGLLHDVIEDTLMSGEELRSQFGDEVFQIVDGVTKISQVQFTSRHQKQADNFRKMLLAMVDDIRVLFVKLADRLHNMRTLQYLPPDARERISQGNAGNICTAGPPAWHGKDSRRTGGPCLQLFGSGGLSRYGFADRSTTHGEPGFCR